MVRSLESLRDLDYDSWQAVAYREGAPGQPVVLRIVGYPGKVRLEHPVVFRCCPVDASGRWRTSPSPVRCWLPMVVRPRRNSPRSSAR